MKKKIATISILTIFMLVTISYATALNTTNTENKESPLYRIRTSRAITEKIGKVIENIKAKFLEKRVFYLPFQKLLTGEEPVTTQSGCTYDSFKACISCSMKACGPPSIIFVASLCDGGTCFVVDKTCILCN